jgi:hypothetical protein
MGCGIAVWLPNPPDGTAVAVAFKGSESNDWTAIRVETREGFLFTPRYGPDLRPTIWNPVEWEGRIPRGEVHAAVDEIHSRFRVKRMYCEPSDWYSEIGEWSLKYGDEVVTEWPIGSVARMYPAIKRFETDLLSRITHDGCELTSTCFKNVRKVPKPGEKYLLAKATEHQKIDPAIASIIAHEAASDAREAGWVDVSSRMIVY